MPKSLAELIAEAEAEVKKADEAPSTSKALVGGVKGQGAVGESILGLITDPEKRKAALKATGEFVAREALPTIGTIAGNLPPLRNIPGGPAVGRAVGGAAGEGLNQLFGITEPSGTDIGITSATGVIGGGAPRTVKAGTRGLAAFAAPATMKAQGAAVFRESVVKGPTAKSLFAQASKASPVPTQQILNAMETSLNTVRRPRAKKQLRESISQLQTVKREEVKGQFSSFTRETPAPKSTIGYEDAMDEIQRIRTEATSAFKAGQNVEGKELAAAASDIIKELDKISPLIKQANAAYRREKATDAIATALRKGNIVSAIDEMFDTDVLVKGAFSAAEQEVVRDLANDIARITSATVAGRFVMPAIEPVAEMMTNQRGRKLLKFLLNKSGMTINTLSAAAAQLVRGEFVRFNEAKPGAPVPTP